MRRAWLFALLLPLLLLRPPGRVDWPVLVGKATYYGEPSYLFITTKSGERFDPERMAFAVDISLWEKFGERDWWLRSYGRCLLARCNDTGYLAEEGVAVDLTPGAFEKVCGELAMGWCSVRVYAK